LDSQGIISVAQPENIELHVNRAKSRLDEGIMQSNNQTRWVGPMALLAAGVLLVAAGVIVSLANRSARSSTSANDVAQDGAARVSLQDAFDAYQDGSAVLVDVRSAASYENASIPGSISIPLGEIETRLTELNPDDWIITICA
jgi:hypothetical protein